MLTKNKEVLWSVIDNPDVQKVLVFRKKKAMDSTRISLSQLKYRMSDQTGGRSLNVIITSETLPRPTSEGFTHRIVLSYEEEAGDYLVYDLKKDGEIEQFKTEADKIDDSLMSKHLTEKLEKEVARIIEVHGCNTPDEVLSHFEGSNTKPTVEIIDRVLKRVTTGMREIAKRKKEPAEIARQLKMMSEDGLTREQAKASFPEASELLLDKYFPEEEQSSREQSSE